MGKILNAPINVYDLQNLFVFIETTYFIVHLISLFTYLKHLSKPFVFIETTYFISLKPYCIKNAQYQNIITHTN